LRTQTQARTSKRETARARARRKVAARGRERKEKTLEKSPYIHILQLFLFLKIGLQADLYFGKKGRLAYVQPIADRVAKNLEIICKNCQLCSRRNRILIGFITSAILLLGTNRTFHRQNSGALKRFQ